MVPIGRRSGATFWVKQGGLKGQALEFKVVVFVDLGGGFTDFLMLTPTWGNDPI